MPTYEYQCAACSHRFEQFQSMKDAALKKCPECGKSKLERLIGTGAAVIFKGSGFYQTDYRSEAYKSAAKADGESAKAPSADAKSASDAKGPSTNSSSNDAKPAAPAASSPAPAAESKPAAPSKNGPAKTAKGRAKPKR